jgi:hypothetical protein
MGSKIRKRRSISRIKRRTNGRSKSRTKRRSNKFSKKRKSKRRSNKFSKKRKSKRRSNKFSKKRKSKRRLRFGINDDEFQKNVKASEGWTPDLENITELTQKRMLQCNSNDKSYWNSDKKICLDRMTNQPFQEYPSFFHQPKYDVCPEGHVRIKGECISKSNVSLVPHKGVPKQSGPPELPPNKPNPKQPVVQKEPQKEPGQPVVQKEPGQPVVQKEPEQPLVQREPKQPVVQREPKQPVVQRQPMVRKSPKSVSTFKSSSSSTSIGTPSSTYSRKRMKNQHPCSVEGWDPVTRKKQRTEIIKSLYSDFSENDGPNGEPTFQNMLVTIQGEPFLNPHDFYMSLGGASKSLTNRVKQAVGAASNPREARNFLTLLDDARKSGEISEIWKKDINQNMARFDRITLFNKLGNLFYQYLYEYLGEEKFEKLTKKILKDKYSHVTGSELDPLCLATKSIHGDGGQNYSDDSISVGASLGDEYQSTLNYQDKTDQWLKENKENRDKQSIVLPWNTSPSVVSSIKSKISSGRSIPKSELISLGAVIVDETDDSVSVSGNYDKRFNFGLKKRSHKKKGKRSRKKKGKRSHKKSHKKSRKKSRRKSRKRSQRKSK